MCSCVPFSLHKVDVMVSYSSFSAFWKFFAKEPNSLLRTPKNSSTRHAQIRNREMNNRKLEKMLQKYAQRTRMRKNNKKLNKNEWCYWISQVPFFWVKRSFCSVVKLNLFFLSFFSVFEYLRVIFFLKSCVSSNLLGNTKKLKEWYIETEDWEA